MISDNLLVAFIIRCKQTVKIIRYRQQIRIDVKICSVNLALIIFAVAKYTCRLWRRPNVQLVVHLKTGLSVPSKRTQV